MLVLPHRQIPPILGKTQDIDVVATDRYNNTLYDAKAVMRVVQGAITASSTHTPVAIFPNGTHRRVSTLSEDRPRPDGFNLR
jgi:hypothetical protein